MTFGTPVYRMIHPSTTVAVTKGSSLNLHCQKLKDDQERMNEVRQHAREIESL